MGKGSCDELWTPLTHAVSRSVNWKALAAGVNEYGVAAQPLETENCPLVAPVGLVTLWNDAVSLLGRLQLGDSREVNGCVADGDAVERNCGSHLFEAFWNGDTHGRVRSSLDPKLSDCGGR